ncbi:MAG: hypothetical protein ACOC2H_05455 [Spirochaetota bacterium]
MKKRTLLFGVLLFCILSATLNAQQFSRYTNVIDTPTAYTIPHGTYQLGMLAYDEGGLEFKTVVGLTDMFYMGVSFDMEHAIGRNRIKPNVPGVIAKFKVTDGPESFPISFALGYDSFYMGATGKVQKDSGDDGGDDGPLGADEDSGSETRVDPLNRMVYGPYIVVTKPIYILDEEQHISAGFRIPAQPNYKPDYSSYFLSLDVPMGQYFTVKAETERIYWNFKRSEEWLLNFGFRYNIFTKVGLELDLMLEQHKTPNRVVRIEYTDEF